jgi:hypothetical protein
MLQGFEKIHYLAYALFFLGKIMFIVSVGALYSGHENPLPFGIAYAALVFLSFSVGMYDQWRKDGFGWTQYMSLGTSFIAPAPKKHHHELTLKHIYTKRGQDE